MVDLRHFFGLKQEPFPQDVPLKQLYQLPSLSPVESSVQFSVMNKAIAIITGDVGSGKSTSLRYVCSKFHSSEYAIIPLVGGNYSTMELYRQILLHFGVLYQSYQISIMADKIRQQLLEIASRKVTPVLVVDEAHLLKRSVFAQLHTLAQFEYDSKPVLSIILCGQDYLIEHMVSSPVKPLASRVLGRNHLEAIRKEVMEEYVMHHLQIAGLTKQIFSPEALFAIHQSSGGLLRKANNICKTAMLAAAFENNSTVSADHVRMASTETF